MLTAAAYARYSTELQTHNSIAYQMDKIDNYCLKNGIEIVARYADEAESGTNMDRVCFQEMVTAAAAHEFDAIIVYDISRGSRDVSDWFHFRKVMLSLNIQVISVESKIGDMLNPSDFLVELLDVGLGQHQVLTTRQKSIDGTTAKAKTCAFLGGCPPLGYDVIDQKYVINEAEADIVRQIFNMYANGASYMDIIKALNGAKGKKGRPLGKNSLNSILRNDRYIGVYTWNRRKVKLLNKWAGGGPNPNIVQIPNGMPAIISQDVWNMAQARLHNKKANATNKAKRQYLLTGLIVCASCDSTYTGRTTTNTRGVKTYSYVCGNKYRTRTCISPNLPLKVVEDFTVDALKKWLNGLKIDDLATYIADRINASAQNTEKEKRELVDVEEKIQNGVKSILNGIDFPELKDQILSLRKRKEELQRIISNANDRVILPEKIKAWLTSITQKSDIDINQAVRNHVVRILVQPNGDFEVELGIVHISSSGNWT